MCACMHARVLDKGKKMGEVIHVLLAIFFQQLLEVRKCSVYIINTHYQ